MASPSIPPHKSSFLSHCLSADALSFGTYTLKSGRQSPYFFNAGLFHRGPLIRAISTAFAHTLASTPLPFDVLFGPAYKGIPLAATVVDKLAGLDEERYGNVSYSFNRKEAKDHGEGGSIVGAGLKGKRVVIIDDVITAGTAIREAIEVIEREGGKLVGIVVAFDRQERMPSASEKGEGGEEGTKASAIGEVRRQYGIPVLAILTLDDLIAYVKEQKGSFGTEEDMTRLEEYRSRYRATDV
ncbi:orotate phosphoribosyltransferase [Eremomyces bilateralis CBS 781.70]|uniref:Orotate phosphoribosyltransferase n=1 Tax=Eremomyces bilateralis CBS 781.70 TaxID=1392243 RepID=A0A6G1G201_9PEZI|nr:orotate phosphoribosyltransferase [Eremomyces bilateralis CBS 781.70]KAF1812084.1 orotate phosphoribosyltransferase [Eremomyces bilateralis CBS 781.70]